MSTKKDKSRKEKPAATKAKHPLKKRKSPRGLKVGKQLNQLLDGLDKEARYEHGVTRRARYDERLVRAARMARMLTR